MTDDELIARMRLRTTVKRLPVMLRNAMQNLGALATIPTLVLPECHRPAFIVGGGPSLEELTPALAEAMRRAGVVLAVNTSEKPLHDRGIAADLAVSIESGETSFQIRESAPAQTWALDLTSHPDTLAAARGRGVWFLHEAMHLLDLARMLGARPIPYGPCAITAAFTMARLMGCAPIVLVGCDMSYARDGRMYDRATHWHEVTILEVGEDEAGQTVGRFAPSAARDGVMTRSGMPPIPDKRLLYTAPAADGGPDLWTTPEFIGMREWLSLHARAMPGRVIQTGLAALGGAEHMSVADAIRHVPPIRDARPYPLAGQPPTQHQIGAVRARIRREADTLSAVADSADAGLQLPYPRMAEGISFAAAWAVADLIQHQHSGAPPDPAHNGTVVAATWRTAARLIDEALAPKPVA